VLHVGRQILHAEADALKAQSSQPPQLGGGDQSNMHSRLLASAQCVAITSNARTSCADEMYAICLTV